MSPASSSRLALWVAWLAALWTFLASPPSGFAFFENALLRAALLGTAVALFRGRAEVRLLVAPGAPARAALLSAIVAGAFVVRFAVEPLPWHAFNWLECLAGRAAAEPEPSWYANGFPVLVRIPMQLGLPVETAIFTANRVAGALSCLALYALDRALFEDPRKALWSAGLLAFLPLHVLLSASETMQLFPSLFALVALFGFAGHARTGSRALLVAGALSMLYAALSRPEAALVMPAVPLLYLARGERRRLRDPAWLAIFGLTVLVAVPLVAHGARQKMATGPTGHFLVGPIQALENAWLALVSSRAPMPELAVLACFGFLLLALRGRPARMAAPLVLLGLLVELAGFDDAFANRWQLLVGYWPWLVLGVSAVPAALQELLRRWARPATRRALSLAWGTGVVAALLASARSPIYRASFDQQEEWRFVRAQGALYQRLGPSLPLVRPDGPHGDGAFATFPAYRVPAGAPVYPLADLLADRVPLPAVYYRGLACFLLLHPWESDGHPMAPRCEEVERAFRLEPIATTRIGSPSFAGVRRPGEAPIDIGFFRVVARIAPASPVAAPAERP